jgi:uncharacterized protein YbaR (Trm112 family)
MEIIHCPFCKHQSELFVFWRYLRKRKPVKLYYVGCPVCGAYGPTALTEEEAISAWNERPDTHDESYHSKIDELLVLNQQLIDAICKR